MVVLQAHANAQPVDLVPYALTWIFEVEPLRRHAIVQAGMTELCILGLCGAIAASFPFLPDVARGFKSDAEESSVVTATETVEQLYVVHRMVRSVATWHAALVSSLATSEAATAVSDADHLAERGGGGGVLASSILVVPDDAAQGVPDRGDPRRIPSTHGDGPTTAVVNGSGATNTRTTASIAVDLLRERLNERDRYHRRQVAALQHVIDEVRRELLREQEHPRTHEEGLLEQRHGFSSFASTSLEQLHAFTRSQLERCAADACAMLLDQRDAMSSSATKSWDSDWRLLLSNETASRTAVLCDEATTWSHLSCSALSARLHAASDDSMSLKRNMQDLAEAHLILQERHLALELDFNAAVVGFSEALATLRVSG